MVINFNSLDFICRNACQRPQHYEKQYANHPNLNNSPSNLIPQFLSVNNFQHQPLFNLIENSTQLLGYL